MSVLEYLRAILKQKLLKSGILFYLSLRIHLGFWEHVS